MLTRHLYEMDEVISALQLCLATNNENGLFWFWELVVSDETEIARQTVLDVWFLRGGCVDPRILGLLDSETETETDSDFEFYTRATNAFQGQGQCHNAQSLLKETSQMESRPNMTPIASSEHAKQRRIVRSSRFIALLHENEFANISKKNAIQFWISLDSACRQGNRVDAIWLLQVAKFYLSDDGIWSALMCMCRDSKESKSKSKCKDVLTRLKNQTNQTNENPNTILYQANAVLYLCQRSCDRDRYQEIKSETMKNIQESLRSKNSWNLFNSVVGRRSARFFAIPRESLTQNTTRGQMPNKYTNISELRNPIPHLEDGCKFWKRVQITDDETYDKYFPDDIPDEWSTADQEKSHGRGCLDLNLDKKQQELITVRETPALPFEWTVAICVRQ
jgi:hypothetical protein